jgi:hypothetical protein
METLLYLRGIALALLLEGAILAAFLALCIHLDRHIQPKRKGVL